MTKHKKHKKGQWKGCHFEKLPEWLQDNEHLRCGHRPPLHTYEECLRSIFRVHTETGNIWTHLIAFVGFAVSTYFFYDRERLAFLCFLVGAMACFLCSTMFHTFSCLSEKAHHMFCSLDYAGIALLTVGSIVTWLYYAFYCHYYTKMTYMIMAGVMGMVALAVTFWEKFNEPKYRPFRALVFTTLGLFGVFPTAHLIWEFGFMESIRMGKLYHMLGGGMVYVLGAALYAYRIPERFLPGRFDIWFQSHQLFHLMVVVAAYIHFDGVTKMAEDNLSSMVSMMSCS